MPNYLNIGGSLDLGQIVSESAGRQVSTSGANEKKDIYVIPRLHRTLIENDKNQFVIIKGGRGGFKTTSFICAMLEYSYEYSECAFLFTREIAKSIEDSVYSVVVDLIQQAGIGADFDIQKRVIINRRTKVRFLFTGLRSTGGKTAMSQINKIKGLHKIRMVFLEEGQDLTSESLDVLIPTANRKGAVRLVNPLNEEELDVKETRFFVAMNPNKQVDPVIQKFRPYVNDGRAVIEHINMMDIVEDEPDFADEELINLMNAERKEFTFGHVWLGEPFHKFAGLPFSQHKVGDYEISQVAYAFLDPSFKGGDFTALAFLAETTCGKAVVFGSAWKSAWNMQPAFDAICNLIRKYEPIEFYYEDNSLGTVPRNEFKREQIQAKPHTSILNKEDRIYKVAGFSKDIIAIASNHCNQIWLTNVIEYSDEAEHDDAPDSLASVIIKSGLIKDRIKWK